MDPDLVLALELADAADAITLGRYRARDLVVERKPDRTLVTEADRAAEHAIRDRLAAARPGDAVLGEELGSSAPSGSARRWIVDPIDGTANYLRGIDIWATLIALEEEGEVRVGVASAPALGHRWCAARGGGTRRDGEAVSVSAVGDLADAQLLYSDIESWERHRGSAAPILDLIHRCWRSRGLGDFWQHVLVAEGCADVAAEPVVSVWDLAAIQVIVEEAGGRFSDLEGRATSSGGSAVSTNGVLHEQVLAVLGARTAA